MTGTIVEIHLSEPLLRLGIDRHEVQKRTTEWLVLSLFTEGRISSGKAAGLLGISRIEFLSLLRKQGISYIDFNENELDEEFSALNGLDIQRDG